MIFHAFNNTMQTRSNIKEAVAGYRKTVEFVVTPAFAYTTNAKYADLVLPVTTPWERVGYFSDKYARECLRSEEHTSELQSLMRISYAGFCLTKQNTSHTRTHH